MWLRWNLLLQQIRKMSLYKVLIVGDSRVRYLGNRLDRTSLNIKFTVKSLPGADLRRVTLKALIEISYDDYHS